MADIESPRKIAEKCVNSIIRDLSDRSGLDGAWDGIDDDIKAEIRKEWEDIITVELGGQPSE